MKMLKPFLFVTVLAVTPSLYANCSVKLSHEQIMDCIVKQNDDCNQGGASVIQARPTDKIEKKFGNSQASDRFSAKSETEVSVR